MRVRPGGANGEAIAPLPFSVSRDEASCAWGHIPSEVAPEALRAAKLLWAAAITVPGPAASGLFAYRDALGPDSLWDFVEVSDAGRTMRIEQWVPQLFPEPRGGDGLPPVEF